MKNKKIIIYCLAFITIIILVYINFKETKVTYSYYADVKTDNHIYNFGKLSVKDNLLYPFTLRNISNNKFFITNIENSSCCLTLDENENTILKNAELVLTIKYTPNTSKIGVIKEKIIIQGNNINGDIELIIEGTVTQ